MPHVFRAGSFVVAVSLIFAGCAADPPDTNVSTGADVAPSATTSAPDASAGSGIVSASPIQYRADWAAGIFQVRIRNDTERRFKIVGVQFVWDGFTTPVTQRNDTLVPGLSLDFPVQAVPATCVGDGLVDDMPAVSTAVARLTLDDGSIIDAPVLDDKGVAQGLYLDDCERQTIESLVTIEWTDLHDETLDGRLVSAGGLRLVRRDSVAQVSLLSISNTILFRVETLETGPDEPIAVLRVGDDEVVAPIRVIENRCDSHARSESSQSFRFFAQVDLGEGDVHQYTVVPTLEDQQQMRARFEAGCLALGDTGFVGQDDG